MLVPLLIALAASCARADDAGKDQLIEQGLAAYAEAQSLGERNARLAAFARAAQLFTQAAAQGNANADLYANAGTAALQAEQLGPAILAFRRALAVDPDHERAQRNLVHARTLLPAWVPRPGGESLLDTFFFWHRSLSAAERSAASALCFLLAALALAAAIRWPGRLARGLAIVLGTVWLGLVASLAVEAHSGPRRDAVMTADETPARASDSANAPARFPDPLPGGTEVEVIELRDRWARIRLANDRDAWVSRQSFELVFPAAAPTEQ